MSLTGPIKTPAQLVAERIYAINANLLQTLQDSLSEGYRTFWNNPGASPQEVADALGTDSPGMMYYHAMLVSIVVPICESSGIPLTVPTAIPVNWSYTVDAVNFPATPLRLTYTPPVDPTVEPVL